MHHLFTLLAIIAFISPVQAISGDHPTFCTIQIPFYSEVLTFQYEPDLIINHPIPHSEAGITQYYKEMETVAYQAFLEDLLRYQKKLNLNDWLFYELTRTTIQTIWHQGSDTQQTLNAWFLLSKAGFDTRITYKKDRIFLYAYSNESIFDTPMIQDDNRIFINLTSIHFKEATPSKFLDMLYFVANAQGQAFSFELKTWPHLKPLIIEKNLAFPWIDTILSVHIEIDQTIFSVMQSYPVIDEVKYLEIPLSKTISKSLLPQLKSYIHGKSTKAALQILVSFTRSAFKYKEDQEHLGTNKPMIPDEVFHYPYSDCEDRSALFYSLVKELLDLPMIIIAYPDHLTIAVAISEKIGHPIRYQEKNYYICDPTGPYQSIEIGRSPVGYEQQSFEILGFYK